MTNKRKRSMLVLLLVLALLVTLPASRAFAEEGAAPTLQELLASKTLTLTVSPSLDSFTNDEDLDSIKITYDLYKVADVVLDSDHGLTIKYENPVVTFSDTNALSYENLVIDPEHPENAKGKEFWDALAQEAAAQLVESGTHTSNTDGKFTGLGAGLYLVIARDTDLTVDDYLVQGDDGKYTTIAQTPGYTYSFTPALVTLPGNDAVTLTTGNWIGDVSMKLKAAQEARFGDLVITKSINAFDQNSNGATFVFLVSYKDKNNNTVEKYYSISFSSSGSISRTIEKVAPVGTQVTVTEVYSGGNYTSSGGGTRTILAPTAEGAPVSVSFSNTHNGSFTNGWGIENQFVFENGEWQHYVFPGYDETVK